MALLTAEFCAYEHDFPLTCKRRKAKPTKIVRLLIDIPNILVHIWILKNSGWLKKHFCTIFFVFTKLSYAKTSNCAENCSQQSLGIIFFFNTAFLLCFRKISQLLWPFMMSAVGVLKFDDVMVSKRLKKR